jgi:hypothetical protein
MFDGIAREMFFKETKYVNLGLMFGLKRSGQKIGVDAVSDTSDSTLGERCRTLIRCCPPDIQEAVMRTFLHHHRRVLEKIGIPWFVPESWGGVGLPIVRQSTEMPANYEPGDPLPPCKWSPSDLDLRVAARIRECPRDLAGKPLYRVGKPPVEAPWDIHQKVLERLPVELQYGTPSERELHEWETIYGALVFDVFLTDVTLMTAKSNLGACRVLKQNQRSWQAARRAGRLPPPLSVATLFAISPPQPYLSVITSSIYTRAVKEVRGIHVDAPAFDVLELEPMT